MFKPRCETSYKHVDVKYICIPNLSAAVRSCLLVYISGGRYYKLTCSVVASPIFYMRDKDDDGKWPPIGDLTVKGGSRIYERMCKFKVNGVSGTGISEWCYE